MRALDAGKVEQEIEDVNEGNENEGGEVDDDVNQNINGVDDENDVEMVVDQFSSSFFRSVSSRDISRKKLSSILTHLMAHAPLKVKNSIIPLRAHVLKCRVKWYYAH